MSAVAAAPNVDPFCDWRHHCCCTICGNIACSAPPPTVHSWAQTWLCENCWVVWRCYAEAVFCTRLCPAFVLFCVFGRAPKYRTKGCSRYRIYIYIYICCKVKNWSKISFFYKLKTGFLCFLVIHFQKSHSSCRKKRIFEKQAKNNPKKTHFYKLKTGPIMLRNILGPVFNLYLDQFLTYKICYFFFFSFWGGGGLKPLFLWCFQQTLQI